MIIMIVCKKYDICIVQTLPDPIRIKIQDLPIPFHTDGILADDTNPFC